MDIGFSPWEKLSFSRGQTSERSFICDNGRNTGEGVLLIDALISLLLNFHSSAPNVFCEICVILYENTFSSERSLDLTSNPLL